MKAHASRPVAGILFGMGAGAMWGMVFLAPRITPDASPALMAAGRYLAYGLIALALIAPSWRSVMTRLPAMAWLALVMLSLFGNLIYYGLLVVGVQLAGVAASAVIVGMVPVVVALWGLRRPGAVPFRRVILPILLAAAAVVLIGAGTTGHGSAGSGASSSPLLGLMCAILALLSWSAYAIANSHWMDRLPEVTAHEWSLLTGVVTGGLALLIVPLAWLTRPEGWDAAAWQTFGLVSVAVAVGASILGNAFWNQAGRLMPLTMLGQMIVFETLFALVYGFFWAQRWPTPVEGVAVIMMVVSVIWCVRAHAPVAEPIADGER